MFDPEPKVYIEVFGSDAERNALRAELEAAAPNGPWTVERDAQRKYSELSPEVDPPPTVVEFDADIPQRSLVWLFWKHDRAIVTNITPRERGGLSSRHYNRIAELFVERVLRATAAGRSLDIRVRDP